ncbi:MAG: hypothetical protein EOP04_16515 [Proteobacteria bacterium]|nr:MAG: hypothetical protein EOP04_16515 [Pseudomonadota bacterium]
MKSAIIFLCLVSMSAVASQNQPEKIPNAASTSLTEGFHDIDKVSAFFPQLQKQLQDGIFKVQIGDNKDMHGTAFLINSKGDLLTNVHNVKSCLDEHGSAKTGYDGSRGPLPCKILSLRNFKGDSLGAITLIASHPYSPAEGPRIEVAVIRSESQQVLSQKPLKISGEEIPAKDLLLVGFAGKTTRSGRAIAADIRKLNQVMQFAFEFGQELGLADVQKLSSDELTRMYLGFFAKAQPLMVDSNELAKILFPDTLTKWHSMPPAEVKSAIEKVYVEFRPVLYSYIKMLENLKYEQYRKGFAKSYPDADNNLKVAGETLLKAKSRGIWLLKGDARPGSSGSPVVDENGSVHGILFAIGLINPNVRTGCSVDVEFSDWESGKYSQCSNAGALMVDAKLIRESLIKWNVETN